MAVYTTTLTRSEEQRQLLVIALAELAEARPGWLEMIRELVATKLSATVMFDELRSLRACEGGACAHEEDRATGDRSAEAGGPVLDIVRGPE